MATRSNIAIRLKDEDKNKVIRFNKDLVPENVEVKYADEIDFNSPNFPKECIESNTGSKDYVSIYCHFDGYPSGVGAELLENFKTYEQVLNLISMGALSSVAGLVKSYAMWSMHDIERQKQNKGSNIGTYEEIEKYCTNNKNGILQEEYAYLFEDGKWYFCSYHDKETEINHVDETKTVVKWYELTEEEIKKWD